MNMSLLSEAYTPCVVVNRAIVSDGEGGVMTTWTDGAEIMAAVRFDSSMQARIGEAQGVTALYTIITNKDINLQYHDVVRRLEDNKTFRVTSDGDDNKTPESAGLNMREVTAEAWKIPND